MIKQLLSETRFLYNENQQLVLSEKLNSEGEIQYRKSIDYDDSNRIIKENIIDNSKIPNYILTREYYYGEPNNDKTYSIVESTELKGEIENIINRLIEVDYDIDSLIMKTSVNGDIANLKSYDIRGNLIYERYINDDSIDDFYYMYNNDNKLIKKLSNDEIFEETEYDNLGRVIYSINRDNTDNSITKNIYKYDDQNNLIEQIIDCGGNEKKKVYYKYFKTTKIISYYIIDDQNKEIHQYDDVIMQYSNNKHNYITPTTMTEKEYDSNNNIVKISEYKIIC